MHFLPHTPIILVGLKSDLRFKKTCIDLLKTQGLTPVTPEQGRAVAAKMGATYMECSSKEMTGVAEIFDVAVRLAVGEEDGGDDGVHERDVDRETGDKARGGLVRPSGRRRKEIKRCTIL